MPVDLTKQSLVSVPTEAEFQSLQSRVAALELVGADGRLVDHESRISDLEGASSGGSSGAAQVFLRQHSGDQDLFRDFRAVGGMSATFSCDVQSRVILTGHIDAEHRGLVNDAVMVAAQAQIDGSWMDGAKTGENIVSPKHHYVALPLSGYAEVAAGTHTVEVFARSASTAAPDTDGLAELKPLYNAMIVRVEPL